MDRLNPVPIYVARIEESADGFRAAVTRGGELVYRGEARPDREAARKDAALFVILREEDEGILRWAEDGTPPPAPDPEPHRYPVWRGGREVGWVTLEYPLEAGTANCGTFHPGPDAGPVVAVLEAAAAGQAWEAALNAPRPEAATDAAGRAEREAKQGALQELFDRHEAALEQVESLGLVAGDPPLPITGLTIADGWRVNFYAAREGP
jgi:hypothetical protein